MVQASNKYTPKGAPAKAIKRVFTIGKDFVCGMCRTPHGDLATAQSCVMRCYVEWIHSLEVKHFKRGSEDVYQCPICNRHNLKKNIVIRCMKDCKQKGWNQHQLEASLLDVDGDLPETPERTQRAHLDALKIDRRRNKTLSEQELTTFGTKAAEVESRKEILLKQKEALAQQKQPPPPPSYDATEEEF